jgi:hypothetical protein
MQLYRMICEGVAHDGERFLRHFDFRHSSRDMIESHAKDLRERAKKVGAPLHVEVVRLQGPPELIDLIIGRATSDELP